MALDEPRGNDDVYDVKGFQFVVDKDFMKQAKSINVDFTGMGFHIDSQLDLGSASSGCSSCGSSGSCG